MVLVELYNVPTVLRADVGFDGDPVHRCENYGDNDDDDNADDDDDDDSDDNDVDDDNVNGGAKDRYKRCHEGLYGFIVHN